VFSRDGRYGFVFGRDGGVSKIDLLEGRLVKRAVQAGNSVGGAISQDGSLVAVSNYDPGGVRVFDVDTLALVADIPAQYGTPPARSKVVGLVDAPGQLFVFSLYPRSSDWWTRRASFSCSASMTRARSGWRSSRTAPTSGSRSSQASAVNPMTG
jgi:protein NirF